MNGDQQMDPAPGISIAGEIDVRRQDTVCASDGLPAMEDLPLGPTRFLVGAKHYAARRPFAHRLIVRETAFHRIGHDSTRGIQTLYTELAADQARNELIFTDVIGALHEGRTPIVLTERKDHLDDLAARLHPCTRRLIDDSFRPPIRPCAGPAEPTATL